VVELQDSKVLVTTIYAGILCEVIHDEFLRLAQVPSCVTSSSIFVSLLIALIVRSRILSVTLTAASLQSTPPLRIRTKGEWP
jgi:hypothetical protein